MKTDPHSKHLAISHVVTPVALVVAALLCFLIMIGYFLHISYQHAVIDAVNETYNLVGVLESRLSSEFAHVDGMLKFVTHEMHSEPLHGRSAVVSAAQAEDLVQLVTSFPQLSGLFIFGAEGTLQMASDPDVKPYSVADSPDFQTLRDHPNISLVFSEPIMSPSTGKWSLIQSRSIRDDAGRFLGIVHAVLDIDKLSDLFRNTNVEHLNGVISLRRSDDFTLVTRIPHHNKNNFDQPLPADHPVRRFLESGGRQGTLAYTSSSDAVRRIACLSRLDDRFPFYVQVAFSADHYLAAWRQQVLWMGLLVMPLLLAFAVALVRLKSNITERKQAELMLLSESEKNKALLRNGSDGITIVDVNANLIEVSDSFCNMLGYSRDEMIGMNVTNWDCGFDSQGEFMKAFSQHFQGQTRSLCRSRHRRKDGSIYDVEINIQTIDLEGQQVMFGSHRDMTERIKSKELLEEQFTALKLSEGQMATSQRIGGIGSCVYDFKTDRIRASTQMLRTFGFPTNIADCPLDDFLACVPQHRDRVRDTLAGKFGFPHDIADYPLDDLLASIPEHDPVRRALMDLLNQSHEYDGEFTIQPADGSQPKVIHAIGKLERDSQATPIKILGFMQDVTERRKTEAELREAKIAAEAANVTKSQFLATMSHEIRTPMGAVIGMTHLMLKTNLLPRQQHYMKKILESGQHLLGIIDDILDVSKIEAGKMTLEKIPFDLEQVLSNVNMLIAEKVAAKGLELIFDVERNVPVHLVGDPLRLSQILLNYANNAVKFTAQGEVDVVVRVREETPQDVLLYFAVRDTGIGLSPDQCQNLFQVFQQADTSTTRQYGGSGLGLAIVKNLTGMMQGEVGVESVLGQGSTFWFTARLGRGVMVSPQRILNARLQGLRALVIDDNDTARMVLSDMLESMGFVVEEASGGSAAIHAVDQAESHDRPFDFVFIDWQMPGMDGLEVARRLQARPLQRTPHLVMVTAFGREDMLKGVSQIGLTDVLIKPVSASMLFDNVMSVMGDTLPERRKRVRTAPSLAAEQLASIKGARILLVEDNELNQEVATEFLRDAGLIVDVADNGHIALQKVQQASFDLVLMDMQMPVMDGVSATRAIRQLAQFADLPIIAMTANVMESDHQRFNDAGINDHIAKPIDPDNLWRTLLRWIKPQPGRQPAASSETTPLSPDDLAQIPSGIAGLDTASGLRRVLGKKSLYLSMLRRFATGQKGMVAALQTALDQHDLTTALRLVHTAKSTAASIGAADVQALAAALEHALGHGAPVGDLQTQVQVLDGPLTTLIIAIENSLPALTAPMIAPMTAPMDEHRLAEVCKHLQSLLAFHDASVVDVVDDHADLLYTAFPAHYRRLETAIKMFDLEIALQILNDAVQTLSNPPP